MKIGVISSYACVKSANNYGALLQYFALQSYLRKRGHDPFWIKSILPQSSLRIFARHVKNYRSLRLVIAFYKCHKTFESFQNRYLSVTGREYQGNADLSKNCPQADYYITGSDQVWGGALKENYLRFVADSTRKIAYAASFGRDQIDTVQMETITPWIQDFAYVSVREASGVDICRSMGVNAFHLLDPTLLIDADTYPGIEYSGINNLLTCYFLNVDDTQSIRLNEIRKYAIDEGLKLQIASCQYAERFFKKDELVMPSPEEWLQKYRDAKCIVTNTFHGTAFAIIFQKPFVTILQSGASATQNTRMLSLLEMFGLKERIWGGHRQLADIMSIQIDWKKVESKLHEYRKKSDDFFQNIAL